MKIRTDFVTNSSSSSFISCRIGSPELADFIKKYKLRLTNKNITGRASMEGNFVSIETDEFFSFDENILNLLYGVLTKQVDSVVYEGEEYDWFGIIDFIESETPDNLNCDGFVRKNDDSEDEDENKRESYWEHKLQNVPDGTPESITKAFLELIEKTDFARKMRINYMTREFGNGEDVHLSELLDCETDDVCDEAEDNCEELAEKLLPQIVKTISPDISSEFCEAEEDSDNISLRFMLGSHDHSTEELLAWGEAFDDGSLDGWILRLSESTNNNGIIENAMISPDNNAVAVISTSNSTFKCVFKKMTVK